MPSIGYRYTQVVEPVPPPGGLISLADAKVVLGIGDDSQDATVQAGIDSVSAAIVNFCDRYLVPQTYRDTLRHVAIGFGKPLRAHEYPIQTDDAGAPLLFTVTVDDVVLDPATYELDPLRGRVFRDEGWQAEKIVIDYKAGYDPIPADLQAAASQWLATRWMAQGRDPNVRTENVFDVIAVTYNDPSSSAGSGGAEGPPPGVCSWLIPYRRWSV